MPSLVRASSGALVLKKPSRQSSCLGDHAIAHWDSNTSEAKTPKVERWASSRSLDLEDWDANRQEEGKTRVFSEDVLRGGSTFSAPGWIALRKRLSSLTKSKVLHMCDLVSSGLVVVNVIAVAIETDQADGADSLVAWLLIDSLFILAYSMELAIRAFLLRHHWLRSAWNWMDAAIIVLGLADLIIVGVSQERLPMTMIVLVKLVRLVRVAKLVKMSPELVVILSASWYDLTTVMGLGAFVGLGILVFANLSVTFVGRNNALDGIWTLDGTRTVQSCFNTIPGAFRSMFEIMTLDGWEKICRPTITEIPGLAIFFLTYIVLFTFGALNMVIALAIQKTNYHADLRAVNEVSNRRRVIGDFLGEFQESIRKYSADRNANVDDISDDLDDPESLNFADVQGTLATNVDFSEVLEQEGFPQHRLQRLYNLLDGDSRGKVPTPLFFCSLKKLMMEDNELWDEMSTHATLRHTQSELRAFYAKLKVSRRERMEWVEQVQRRQEAQGVLLRKLQGCLGEESVPYHCRTSESPATCTQKRDTSPCDSMETFVVTEPWQTSLRATARAVPEDHDSSSCVVPSDVPHLVPGEVMGEKDKEQNSLDKQKYSVWSIGHVGSCGKVVSDPRVSKEESLKAKYSKGNTTHTLASRAGEATLKVKRAIEKRMIRFDTLFVCLTVLNLVVLAAETNVDAEDQDGVGWIVIDSLFTLAFLVEIACRMYWEREAWPHKVWNWFDVVMTVLAMVDVWILTFVVSSTTAMQVLPALRVFRMVRLVRMLKFIRHSQELYVIMLSLFFTCRALSNLVAVMVMAIFVYSLFLVEWIGHNGDLRDISLPDGTTATDRFGTVPRTMYSLFELLTLEGWTAIYRPIIEKEPLLFVPVAFFIMVITFAMLNMVTAFVIMRNIECRAELTAMFAEKAEAELDSELTRALSNMTKKDATIPGNNELIDFETFQAAIKSDASLRKALARLGCAPRSYIELFKVFDWDESGTLEAEELMMVCSKLKGGSDTLRTFLSIRAIAAGNKSQMSRLSNDLSRSRLEAVREHKVIDDIQATQDVALDSIERTLCKNAGWQRELRVGIMQKTL